TSPLEEMFWLPSAGWMLTFDAPVPEVGQPAIPRTRGELRRFALDFYLRSLSSAADRRVRTVAVSMLYQPALFSNDEVATAASRLDAGNFRRLLPDAFARELRQAADDDKFEPKLELTPDRIRNFTYFRDFVIPELGRENRADSDSCFSCHGGGKVPSMSLAAPDRRSRLLEPREMWMNYRTLLERINPADIEN